MPINHIQHAVELAMSPGPFPALQCCTLKTGRAWYTKSCAECHGDQSWCGMMQTKSRSIEINKIGLFLRYPCLLSTRNIRFKPSKDRLLLVWQRHSRVSCHLLAVVLTCLVTFDPRDSLDLLSPSLSITWLCVPGPLVFQRAYDQTLAKSRFSALPCTFNACAYKIWVKTRKRACS